MDKFKCLVINPSPAKLQKAVEISAKLNGKNGPFELILFLGDLASKDGNVEAVSPDLTIYHTEGRLHVKKSTLDFLGTCGIKVLGSGLRIGYVGGGRVSEEELKKVFDRQYVDILVSYYWPKLISDEERLASVGQRGLDCLLDLAKPRYWFAVGSDRGRHFERQPFADESTGRITRFISLAQQGAKEKWYYAFNLPRDSETDKDSVGTLGTRPAGLTLKRPLEDTNKDTKRSKPTVVVSPSRCFFCLSNPKVELHMIVSIGTSAYMTVAKGPIIPLKASKFGFSGHGLIVPISHFATLRRFRDSECPTVTVEETPVYREMAQYKESVAKMFFSLGDYAVVFWEISRADNVHLHTQFVPIPAAKAEEMESFLVQQIGFSKERYGQELAYVKDPDNYSEVINSEDYMDIAVATKEGTTHYLFTLSGDLDLQFPRKVVAFLLNRSRRIRWDKCKEEIGQETEQAEQFKKRWGGFDFTQES